MANTKKETTKKTASKKPIAKKATTKAKKTPVKKPLPGRDGKGKFEPKNEIWKRALDSLKNGRPRIFETPEDYLRSALEYFQYIDDNPHTVSETTLDSKGGLTVKTKTIKQPYTWSGFRTFLGVVDLDGYKEKAEYSGVIKHIDEIMRTQKLSLASAGILKENIIARELGLWDKQKQEIEITKVKPPRREFKDYSKDGSE